MELIGHDRLSHFQHLAERREATVDAIEQLIGICLPEELMQRKAIHEEEMAAVTV